MYLLVCFAYGVWSAVARRARWSIQLPRWHKQNIVVALVIGLGVVMQLIPIVGSGWQSDDGVRFFQINKHDGIFHLSLMRSMQRSFPPEQPGAVGLPVTNYHYWSDASASELSRVWGLSLVHVYFHFIPVLLAVVLGVLVWSLLRLLCTSLSAAWLGLLTYYFAGDVTSYVYYVLHQSWSFTLPAIDNGSILFLNMPTAYAKVLFCIVLWCVIHIVREKMHILRYWCTAAVVAGVLCGFKVYFGAVSMLGLGMIWFWQGVLWLGKGCWYVREQWRALRAPTLGLMIGGLVAAIVYLPVNKTAGGLFFVPLAWPKLLFAPEKLHWQDWWLRIQWYEAHQNWAHLWVWLVGGGVAFVAMYLLYRCVGLVLLPTMLKRHDRALWWFFVPPLWIFLLVGLNFLQVSGEYNVFNFVLVAMFLATFTTALLYDWLAHAVRQPFLQKAMLLACGVVLCFSFLRPVMYLHETIVRTLRNEDAYLLSNDEAAVFRFLAQLPKHAVIQAHLRNGEEYETPYVSYFTNHPTYLGGTGILKSHNQPIQQRVLYVQQAFSSSTPQALASAMRSVGVTHLYLRNVPEETLPFSRAAFVTSGVGEIAFENAAGYVVALR
jgi:hypothetical protein